VRRARKGARPRLATVSKVMLSFVKQLELAGAFLSIVRWSIDSRSC